MQLTKVKVRVKDNVVALVPEGSPVRSPHEAVLDHERNERCPRLQQRVDGLHKAVVIVDSVGIGDGVGSAKVSQTGVSSFVSGAERESAWVGRTQDEGDHRVDDVDGFLEMSSVVPPTSVTESFTDVERVG